MKPLFSLFLLSHLPCFLFSLSFIISFLATLYPFSNSHLSASHRPSLPATKLWPSLAYASTGISLITGRPSLLSLVVGQCMQVCHCIVAFMSFITVLSYASFKVHSSGYKLSKLCRLR